MTTTDQTPGIRDTSNMTNRYLAVVKDDQGIKELQRLGFASTLTLERASITTSMSKVACLLHFSLLMISHVFERSKQVGPREHSPAAIGHFLSVSLFSVFMGDYTKCTLLLLHYNYRSLWLYYAIFNIDTSFRSPSFSGMFCVESIVFVPMECGDVVFSVLPLGLV